MENSNDPAFPVNSFYGLSKREHFAGLAMQGILANKLTVAKVTYEQVASHSVKQADALLAELSKETK